MIVDIGNPTHCLRDCPVCDCERMVCKADPFARPVDWTTDTVPDWCPGKDPVVRKVRDVVGMLFYGVRYRLVGAHTGKILHDSGINKEEHLKQFLDEELSYNALDVILAIHDEKMARPVMRIWVSGR